MRKLFIVMTAATLWISSAAPAQAAGLLTPVGSTTPLSIRDHAVRVVVEDGYVVTEVDQVFINSGTTDVEAHYTFPVPEHAAVSEFTYWIGGNPVHGEVLEKQRATELYESEKAAGRDAALAEKDAYRTFDVRVTPVRAGQDTRVRLVYLQSAHVDTGIGRYVYPLEEGGVDEERTAFWEVRDTVSGNFSFTMDVKSSYPIDAVRVPGHGDQAGIQVGDGHWRVDLARLANVPADFDEQIAALESGETPMPAPVQKTRLDKDIVVYWRHATGLPGSVDLVAHKQAGDKLGTFMLTVTPGDDLPIIEQGRDWVFVLDVSGSMQGKFATLAQGVQKSLGTLNSNDRFRIYTFSNSPTEITQGFHAATQDQISHYVDVVGQLASGGGTNLHAGLSAGLNGLDSDRTSAIALITDGVANVGITKKRSFLKLLQQYDVRLFTFILGNSANRPLLEAMTEVSNGFSMSTSNSDDISGQLLQAVGKVRHAAMNNVTLKIDGVRVSDLTPARIGSIYHGEQLSVLGHYRKSGMAQVELSGTVQGQPVAYTTEFKFPDAMATNPELERLWAYATIENMQQQLDYFGDDDGTTVAMTELAVEYGLVTDHTSMIVVSEAVFEANNITRRNRDMTERDRAAREQRQQQAPQDRRVDTTKPLYKSNRPSTGGGGGSFGIWMLAMLVGALVMRRR